jgi:hypothetical protein
MVEVQMPVEGFQFQWPVPAGGYRWVDMRLPEGVRDERVLVPGVVGGLAGGKTYGPLNHPGLFRDFADCPATEEAFLAFANKYGALEMPGEMWSPDLSGAPGEPFWLWMDAHSRLRQAITLWDVLERGDRDTLARLIRREKDGSGQEIIVYDPLPDLPRVMMPRDGTARQFEAIAPESAMEGGGYRELMRFAAGDLLFPARLFLTRVITRQLRARVLAELVYDFREGRPVLRLVPRTLLGCLWLQLAEAINSHRLFRQCAQCGGWFVIEGRQRKDARFCGTPCRLRAYRGRQERARQLHASGKTFKEIASELKSDVATIKKWVLK